jgi:hypothetical protein
MAAQDYEQVTYNSPAGAQIGSSATEKVGFYGAVPVVQRTFVASLHNTTAIASSTDFTAAHLAVVNEIQNTLRGLGVWATA